MVQLVRVVVAAGAVVLQCAVLYAPRAPAVGASPIPLDKVVHAAVFALATAALIRVGLRIRVVVALMLAQAVVSELVQQRLADRSGELGDVVADVTGIGIAVIALRRRPHRASARSGTPNLPGAQA